MTTNEPRRDIAARWTVTANLLLLTAAQIGSEDSPICDTTFSRTADGLPVLYGTTLTGALRSHLADYLQGYGKDNREGLVERLFGFGVKDEGHESSLICFDSVTDTDLAAIRDGVGIDHTTGTARDGAKYDRELLLPGATFPIRLDLIVPGALDENELVGALSTALKGLESSAISLGARRTRGLGAVAVKNVRAHRYDLTTTTGCTEYAESSYSLSPLEHKTPHTTVQDAVTAAWPAIQPAVLPEDKRRILTATLNINLDSTLLIGSPGSDATSPDKVHLTEAGKAILSGTSIAGAIRAQLARILTTIDAEKAAARLSSLCGSPPEQRTGQVASRLRVSETTVSNARSYQQHRIKVDRFTGGTIDTALFDEQPLVGGACTFTITVRDPACHEEALVVLLIRDLFDGLFTFGSGASVGRGRVTGSATVKLPGKEPVTITSSNHSRTEISNAHLLERSMEELRGKA
jgi:CRISPR/Cas system CSM-associated protein Csm3 (group 7 of RAMP superfamily)